MCSPATWEQFALDSYFITRFLARCVYPNGCCELTGPIGTLRSIEAPYKFVKIIDESLNY